MGTCTIILEMRGSCNRVAFGGKCSTLNPMRTRRHPWRNPLLTVLAVVAVGLLGAQAAVSGLHLACHADTDPAGPVHACAVCAHFWLNPATTVPVTALPPPLSAAAALPVSAHLAPAPALARACVRAPPAVVS